MLASGSDHESALAARLDAVSVGCPRRVLLIEDDADQRSLVAWMIRGFGCEVVEAEGGVDLLGWIAKATSSATTDYDAIVSDVNMPDMTAIEVLKGWRYGSWTTPMILVTASPDFALRAEALALGVADVLRKPLHPAGLRDALERVFAQAGGDRG